LVEQDPVLGRNVREVFSLLFPPQPLEVFLNELDEAGIERAVLLPVDCSSAHGCRIVSNQQVAELASRCRRFIGFASVDPRSDAAVEELNRSVRELGLRGLKLDPALQRFDPGCRERAYPLYDLCVNLDIPVLIHCGLSWAMSGLDEEAHPLRLAPVARDFPKLKLIIPHFAWPWVDEAVMLALKYKNVFLDSSIVFNGTPGDALRSVLADRVGISVLERGLHEQLLFGSNYPRADIRRTVRGFDTLPLSQSLREHMGQTNAKRLLRLE
jgi:predicted TIM-barrel fold metal-dependent hydrolase